MQLGQPKFVLRALVEVVEAEAGEVRHENVLGQLVVFEAGEVVAGLLAGAVEVAAPAFVLHQQGPLPKQVDEALAAIGLLNGHLKGGHPAALHIEDVEEVNPEGLGVGAFVGGLVPFLGKANGAVF